MANRTVKFIGYTADNINVVFRFNGNEVFNGAVSAAGSINAPAELFTFDIDQTIDGNISTDITVTGGMLSVVTLSVNHIETPRVEITGSDGVVVPAVTSDDAVNTYEWVNAGSNVSKKSIVIDGEAYSKEDAIGLDGAWHLHLTNGQTMACDYPISATYQN